MLRYTAVLLTLAVALSACTGEARAPESDPDDPSQVELITWWASGPEYVGYAAAIDLLRERHSELVVLNASVKADEREAALDSIATRLEADNAPDAFLAPGGAGLAEFAPGGALEDLSGFIADHDLAAAYRPELVDLVTIDGIPSALPVAISRVNVLWSNSALLEAAGVDPSAAPPTVEAWLSDLAAVRASGVAYPLALGGDLAQVELFESLLIGTSGVDGYAAWLGGDLPADDGALRRAAEQYLQLLAFVQPGYTRLRPASAVRRVVDLKAAYVVGADSAVQVFDSADYDYGTDYAAAPVPGTAGVYDAALEVFALPVGRSHRESAYAWLDTVTSRAGQAALTAARLSIPVRSDVDPAGYGPYQQAAITALADARIVPSIAYGDGIARDQRAAIMDAVVRFGSDRSIDALVTHLGGA